MTEPPFWWMGLFASVGGLLIVGLSLAVLILALVAITFAPPPTGQSP